MNQHLTGSGERLSNVQILSHAQRPELLEQFERMESDAFPAFMLHDAIWNEHWPLVLAEFADLQLYLLDEATGELAGVFNSVPLSWDGTTEDLPLSEHEVLARSLRHRREGRDSTTLCGIQVAVADSHAGKGVAARALEEGLGLCRQNGLSHLIAPIRPTLKHRYPTIPFEEYIDWKRPDGAAFDPWIRAQIAGGAQRLGVCREPMRFEGSVADWELWTGLEFPASGRYVIEGALDLLHVDVDADRGWLEESNVWYGYTVQT